MIGPSPVRELRTVRVMPALRTSEITDTLLGRLDRTHRDAQGAAAPVPAAPVARRTLTEGQRAHAPTTRRLDEKHRLQCRGLAEQLGTGPCTFDVAFDGHWAVLTSAVTAACISGCPGRNNTAGYHCRCDY